MALLVLPPLSLNWIRDRRGRVLFLLYPSKERKKLSFMHTKIFDTQKMGAIYVGAIPRLPNLIAPKLFHILGAPILF